MTNQNQYKVEIYRIDPVNSLFEKLDEIEGYTSLEFSRVLNGYGSCILTIDPRHSKATPENLRRWVNHIAIKKGDTVVWFGPMTKFTPTIGIGVSGNLVIEAREFMYHLNYRFTDQILRFDAEDAGDIAWALIDHVQSRTNGELMIRQGNTVTTVDRDRTYEYSKISEKIVELSQVRLGFDFDFTYQQDSDNLIEQVNFNVYARKGGERLNLPKLQLGTNVNQILAVTTGDMVNTATYLGAGTGSDVLISPDDDANVQQAFTRREAIKKEPDISVQTTLDQKVQQYLDYNKVERYDVQIQLLSLDVLSFGTLDVGDTLEVDLKLLNKQGGPTLINFEGKTRILEINVEIDENGGEVLTPTISQIY